MLAIILLLTALCTMFFMGGIFLDSIGCFIGAGVTALTMALFAEIVKSERKISIHPPPPCA